MLTVHVDHMGSAILMAFSHKRTLHFRLQFIGFTLSFKIASDSVEVTNEEMKDADNTKMALSVRNESNLCVEEPSRVSSEARLTVSSVVVHYSMSGRSLIHLLFLLRKSQTTTYECIGQ